jgi:hypothetical protein
MSLLKDAILTADYLKYASVANHKHQQRQLKEVQVSEPYVGHLSILAWKLHHWHALAIRHVSPKQKGKQVSDKPRGPRKCTAEINHPQFEVIFVPNRMNNFDVSFDCYDDKVDGTDALRPIHISSSPDNIKHSK